MVWYELEMNMINQHKVFGEKATLEKIQNKHPDVADIWHNEVQEQRSQPTLVKASSCLALAAVACLRGCNTETVDFDSAPVCGPPVFAILPQEIGGGRPNRSS
eukprot:Lankesteria_metandrocarpae@DN5466_c2_g1_i1.p1